MVDRKSGVKETGRICCIAVGLSHQSGKTPEIVKYNRGGEVYGLAQSKLSLSIGELQPSISPDFILGSFEDLDLCERSSSSQLAFRHFPSLSSIASSNIPVPVKLLQH